MQYVMPVECNVYCEDYGTVLFFFFTLINVAGSFHYVVLWAVGGQDKGEARLEFWPCNVSHIGNQSAPSGIAAETIFETSPERSQTACRVGQKRGVPSEELRGGM